MPPGNHVHIISAGENIHLAYPAVFRILPTISHTYVLAGDEGLLVPRQYLFDQVWPLYLRSRARKPVPGQPGAPVVRYKRGHKPANNLSQQTLSTFLATLQKAGFVEEGREGENRKEKAYRITELGETAFRFYADPSIGTSVKRELEGLADGS